MAGGAARVAADRRRLRWSCAALVVAWLAAGACREGGDSRREPEERAPAGFSRLLVGSWPELQSHFTVNEPWSLQESADRLGGAFVSVPWAGRPHPADCHATCLSEGESQGDCKLRCDTEYEAGQIVPYTMRPHEYRRRREECARDFEEIDPDTNDRRCYPVVTEVKRNGEVEGPIEGGRCLEADLTLARIRYGRFCGRGYPSFSVYLDNRHHHSAPFEIEPIDGIDYCCRLHDASAWDIEKGAAHPQNVCGFVMCVAQASGFPPGGLGEWASEALDARQCIYDRAVLGRPQCSLVDDSDDGLMPPPRTQLPAPSQTRLDRATGRSLEVLY